MVKVPARPGLDPSRVRSDNPSGQPKGPSRVRSVRTSARRSSFPRESHPVKSRPARVSACRGFVRSPSPGQQRAVPSRSRPVRGSARQRSGPPEPRPAGVPSRESRTPSSPDPPESRPVEGSFGPSPGQPKGCSIKVPAHPGLGPSKVRSARALARRSSSPGGSPHPSTSGSPPHLFPFPPPSCPPLLYRSGASYPSDAPPLHPAFRCG